MTRITLGVVATLVLGGCASPSSSLSDDLGNAVTHNMAMHIINPSGTAVDEIPGHDGDRVVRAHKRLITEKKSQPSVQFPALILQGASGAQGK